MVARYIACIIIVHGTLKGPLGTVLYTIDKLNESIMVVMTTGHSVANTAPG